MPTVLTSESSLESIGESFEQLAKGDAHTLLQAMKILKNPQRREMAEEAALKLAVEQQEIAASMARVAMKSLSVNDDLEGVFQKTALSVD